MSSPTENNPNARLYQLAWNDTGAPYVHPVDHRTAFTLDEAMRIADREAVSVIDPKTGSVLWIGSEPTRGMRTDVR